MGTGRKFTKTSMTRPTKPAGEKARRQRQQKARLIALGVDEGIVAKMDTRSIRQMLQRPNKIKAGK